MSGKIIRSCTSLKMRFIPARNMKKYKPALETNLKRNTSMITIIQN